MFDFFPWQQEVNVSLRQQIHTSARARQRRTLMARKLQITKVSKRRAKAKLRTKKKDPIFVEGQRPRPMYVDYKDVDLLKKLTNRQGKILGRRKTGCTAVSQRAVARAIKRARFMALLPYVGE